LRGSDPEVVTFDGCGGGDTAALVALPVVSSALATFAIHRIASALDFTFGEVKVLAAAPTTGLLAVESLGNRTSLPAEAFGIGEVASVLATA
jgi:hypothetical protein